MPTTTRAQNQQQVLSESAVFRAASSPRQFKHVSGIKTRSRVREGASECIWLNPQARKRRKTELDPCPFFFGSAYEKAYAEKFSSRKRLYIQPPSVPKVAFTQIPAKLTTPSTTVEKSLSPVHRQKCHVSSADKDVFCKALQSIWKHTRSLKNKHMYCTVKINNVSKKIFKHFICQWGHSVKARAGRPRYVQQMTAKEAENILGDFTWEPEIMGDDDVVAYWMATDDTPVTFSWYPETYVLKAHTKFEYLNEDGVPILH